MFFKFYVNVLTFPFLQILEIPLRKVSGKLVFTIFTILRPDLLQMASYTEGLRKKTYVLKTAILQFFCKFKTGKCRYDTDDGNKIIKMFLQKHVFIVSLTLAKLLHMFTLSGGLKRILITERT